MGWPLAGQSGRCDDHQLRLVRGDIGIFGATAATIGTVAIPEMINRGYEKRFVYGLLAAGGTLGILIPPSIPMIVYGFVTEQSVIALFLAGIGLGYC